MNDTRGFDDSAEETNEESAAISNKAWEIISKGARDNPECENAAIVDELVDEAMVFRIFRQRHRNGDLLLEADR